MISITRVENNRVTKYASFTSLEECASHAQEYNGIVYNGEYSPDLWVENGVVSVVPYIPPLVVPQVVSMRQARLALYNANLLHLVDESLASMPIEEQRVKSQIEWEYATVVDRNSPLAYGLAGALGLTDKALDNLFIEAAKL